MAAQQHLDRLSAVDAAFLAQEKPNTHMHIGGVALLAFGVIFFRLWYLQVLSGDQYEAKANDNRVREIKVQAPRGEVVDRDGRVLVDFTEFLVRDANDVAGRLQPGTYRFEAGRSTVYMPMTNNFPKNTEMEAELTFVRQPGAAAEA